MNRPRKLVFIIGCPRSGTTWLQLLLFQHPAITTAPETHLFSHFLQHLDNAWRRKVRGVARGARKSGMHALLSGDEFDGLLRDFASAVFDRMRRIKPDAEVVVEKSPSHTRVWPLMLRLFPQAGFLHIVRDPRSVVASLRQSHRGWGRPWASADAVQAANYWCSYVSATRRLAERAEHYREIRYEDLLENGALQLQDIFRWLNVNDDPALCARIFSDCHITHMQQASPRVKAPWSLQAEPEGFYRRGQAAGWREELAGTEIQWIEHVTGDLMEHFGYRRMFPARRRQPLRVYLHGLREPFVKKVVKLMSRAMPRLLHAVRETLDERD